MMSMATPPATGTATAAAETAAPPRAARARVVTGEPAGECGGECVTRAGLVAGYLPRQPYVVCDRRGDGDEPLGAERHDPGRGSPVAQQLGRVACFPTRRHEAPEQVGDLDRIGLRHVGPCAERVPQLLPLSVEHYCRAVGTGSRHEFGIGGVRATGWHAAGHTTTRTACTSSLNAVLNAAHSAALTCGPGSLNAVASLASTTVTVRRDCSEIGVSTAR